MELLLRGGLCVDARAGLPEPVPLDVVIEDGYIKGLRAPGLAEDNGAKTIDLHGKFIVPGLMDMHVHLRDPGQEYKEDIVSGTRAAAMGGFTAVLAMPNTQPVIDNGAQVRYVLEKAKDHAWARVYTTGSITLGQKGEALAEMADMARAGAVAFTDDGRGVQDSGLMRLAMDYLAGLEKPLLSHCQVEDLVGSGQVNEGVMSTRLGLTGWPAAGEEVQIARDIALAELTGASLHIQHLSTKKGLELVREAKLKGLPVTCEASPHHLFLDESALDEHYDTNLKMNPPLRTALDASALRAGLIEGVVDCIATDHAPHASHEKMLEFEIAPFGVTGLETALGLVLTELVNTGEMTLATLVERMSHKPREILNIADVSLSAGSFADLTVIDLDKKWIVSADSFTSKSNNNAFIGFELQGKASDVFIAGAQTLENGVLHEK
ncbi:MAG: dihydroorotase [Coriobacteriia bacterium]|nr:dihydroorotase [Coriobacteriia bacterium]